MAHVIGTIGDSFTLYRAQFREVYPPFLALFAISVALALLNFGLSTYSKLACGTVTEANMATCISAEVGGLAFQLIEPLIGVFILLAALVPLREAIEGKAVSDWTTHLPRIALGAVKVIAARFVLDVISALPLLIGVFLVLGSLIALASTGQTDAQLASSVVAFLFGGGAVVLVGLALTVALMVAFTVATTFFELEIVYSRRGVLDALAASYATVRANLVDVLIFQGVWFLLSLALGFAVGFTACFLVCLGPFVSAAFSALAVLPVRYFSTIMLWKRFAPAEPPYGGSGANRY